MPNFELGVRNTNQRRVPRGHVSIRNPLQAPKERSCGISITSPSSGSAKRDRLSSSISDGMCKSPFGELILGGAYLPTAALLRSLQWVSDGRSRSAEPAAHTQSARVRGCEATNDLLYVGAGLRRDAIASYVCLGYLCVALFITSAISPAQRLSLNVRSAICLPFSPMRRASSGCVAM